MSQWYVHPDNGRVLIRYASMIHVNKQDVGGVFFIVVNDQEVSYASEEERNVEFTRIANNVPGDWYLHPNGSTLVKYEYAADEEGTTHYGMWLVEKAGGGLGIAFNGRTVMYDTEAIRDAQYDVVRSFLNA